MLERVCSGRRICVCSADVPNIQARPRKTVMVHLNSPECPLNQRRSSATKTPGALMSKLIRIMRVSKLNLRREVDDVSLSGDRTDWKSGSEAIFLHAPVKSAAT